MMLDVRGLGSGYGRIPILTDITLNVAQGDFVGILGHNGAGKSTLLKTLVGAIPVKAGSLTFNNLDMTRLPTHKRAAAGLGYVPQGRQIFPALSVRENLAISAFKGKVAIDDVLNLFPRLTRLLDRAGGALSGGEQQLLALARCLCNAPKLMLLDEPTEGIQPSIIEEIIDTLKLINEQRGITIILVEQNLEFLTALARRVLILKRGRLREEVDPKALHDPAALDKLML
ncbi:ABC transporter ATP-binding protein [Mesorhizobium sp. CO1-1-8]|uniref:ABC transporter ATP-binding protein n=1 Tax=Mesorhizobium sp. CO1-1-8 TaxID=2876631 RepID=UPI001CD0964C|nr:ABC transporter ATP-binding protein [Mesorhizobium sp. CO1-1-8]MBZ9772546.1 ABC transporter ATP-binding protein [Mesorhizobium sp. CO1-1-8]